MESSDKSISDPSSNNELNLETSNLIEQDQTTRQTLTSGTHVEIVTISIEHTMYSDPSNTECEVNNSRNLTCVPTMSNAHRIL